MPITSTCTALQFICTCLYMHVRGAAADGPPSETSSTLLLPLCIYDQYSANTPQYSTNTPSIQQKTPRPSPQPTANNTLQTNAARPQWETHSHSCPHRKLNSILSKWYHRGGTPTSHNIAHMRPMPFTQRCCINCNICCA